MNFGILVVCGFLVCLLSLVNGIVARRVARSLQLCVIAGMAGFGLYIFWRVRSDIALVDDVFEFVPKMFSFGNGDVFGLLFVSFLCIMWFFALVYSFSYMDRKYPDKNTGLFFACYSLCVMSGIFLAFSNSIVTIFVCYEFLTLCTIPIIAFDRGAEVSRGVKVYILNLLLPSVLILLPAVVMMQNSIESGSNELHFLLFMMFMLGVAKAAILPFNSWLSSAMVAPVPVSALLHGVVVVNVGVFVLFRFFESFVDLEQIRYVSDSVWFVLMNSLIVLTIVLFGVRAFLQTSLKSRLAYSTISQVAMCVLMFMNLSAEANEVAFILVLIHGLAKIVLFFFVGFLYVSYNEKNISGLNGMFALHPYVSCAFAISCLSILGIPFTGGYVAKKFMILASHHQKNYDLIWVMIVGSICSMCYILPMLYRVFFLPPKKGCVDTSVRFCGMKVAIIFLSVLNLGYGIVSILGII